MSGLTSSLEAREKPLFPTFRNVTHDLGLDYFGNIGELDPQVATMFVDNEGIYAADIDNDARTEFLLLGEDRPKLYGFNGRQFESLELLPAEIQNKKINAAVFTDYNKNGFPDLILVPQTGKITLLKNNSGIFRLDRYLSEPDLESGIGATAGDYNSDGCPDVFVIQYGKGSTSTPLKQKRYRYGARYRNLSTDNGHQNVLLTGNCKTLQYDSRSIFERKHWSLATSFADLNRNGRTDLHVANDFGQDSIYWAESDGTFHHQYLGIQSDRNGMSSTVIDVNQNGFPDLFVSNIYLSPDNDIFDHDRFTSRISVDPQGHNLFVNQKNRTFEDRAEHYSLRKGGWGWSVATGDFNHNFRTDLIQGLQNHLAVPPTARQMNLADKDIEKFINRYHHHRPIPDRIQKNRSLFEQFYFFLGYPSVWVQETSGSSPYTRLRDASRRFGRLNTRGIISADFDFDGDLDLLVSQFLNEFRVFRNDMAEVRNHPDRWLKIDFDYPGRGGKLLISTGNDTRTIPITSRTDFASQEPHIYHVGFPESPDTISLTLTDHFKSTIIRRNISPGSIVHVGDQELTVRSKNLDPES